MATGMHPDGHQYGHGNEHETLNIQHSEMQSAESEESGQLQCCGRFFVSTNTLNSHQQDTECQINRAQHSRGLPRQTTSGTSQAQDTHHSGHTGEAVEHIEDKHK